MDDPGSQLSAAPDNDQMFHGSCSSVKIYYIASKKFIINYNALSTALTKKIFLGIYIKTIAIV